jgi:DNA topoisomerase-3
MRPIPMNTVEMLKLSSSKLGIGPHATMKAAEELYLTGYLSYPRTESTSYPESFDIKEILIELKGNNDWGLYIKDLLKYGYISPRTGKDMGDHPPITPVGLATGLIGDKGRLYDLILRHFLATVSYVFLNIHVLVLVMLHVHVHVYCLLFY